MGDRANCTLKLHTALLAINTTVNHVTGVSLYYAVYGPDRNLPLDLVMAVPGEPGKYSSTINPQLFGLNIKACFQCIYAFMLQNQDSYIAREQIKPSKILNGQELHVGDQVYYFSGCS